MQPVNEMNNIHFRQAQRLLAKFIFIVHVLRHDQRGDVHKQQKPCCSSPSHRSTPSRSRYRRGC
eukprot:4383659-Pyramimonas_sp.AAC.1